MTHYEMTYNPTDPILWIFIVAPVIKLQPRVVRVEKTKVVIIETHVRCAAPPEVQWFKDQTKMKEDSRKSVNIQQVSKVRKIILNYTTKSGKLSW